MPDEASLGLRAPEAVAVSCVSCISASMSASFKVGSPGTGRDGGDDIIAVSSNVLCSVRLGA